MRVVREEKKRRRKKYINTHAIMQQMQKFDLQKHDWRVEMLPWCFDSCIWSPVSTTRLAREEAAVDTGSTSAHGKPLRKQIYKSSLPESVGSPPSTRLYRISEWWCSQQHRKMLTCTQMIFSILKLNWITVHMFLYKEMRTYRCEIEKYKWKCSQAHWLFSSIINLNIEQEKKINVTYLNVKRSEGEKYS